MQHKNVRMPYVPETNLDEWLKQKEAAVPGLRPGVEKIIYRADEQETETAFSLVYIHGYASSRQELVPVIDRVAQALKANIFYTRLKGHGQDAEAMGEIKINDWLNDVLEAWEIGCRLGERVILVGNSTGAPLAVWLCNELINRQQIHRAAALILLSPNFKPAVRGSCVLRWPIRRVLIRLFIGRYREFTPKNEKQAMYWTVKFRATSLIPMIQAVTLGNRANLEAFRLPVLCVYTEHDKTVSVHKIKKIFKRFGSPAKRLINLCHAPTHVLAGDILCPETTDELVTNLLGFIKEQLIPCRDSKGD
jgi:esterase/lipase